MLIALIAAIFFGEFLIMFLFGYVFEFAKNAQYQPLEIVLNAALLVVVVFPVLYYFVYESVVDDLEVCDSATENAEDQKRQLEDTKKEMSRLMQELNSEKEIIIHEKAKDDAILSGIGEGIVVVDKDSRIIYMNNAAENMIGWKMSEMIGQLYYKVWNVQDDQGNVVSREIYSALATGKVITATTNYYYVRKDKTKFPVAITISPVILEKKTVGVINVFRDITREKEIDRAKTEFVSLASHQLRTPLSSINWYTEMLLDGDAGTITGEQREYLEEIHSGNKRMIGLVNALLNVSRIEMGVFMVEPEPASITEIAGAVISDLTTLFVEKKIAFSTSFEPNLPIVNVDTKLLNIIFQNLLSNAIKYTPVGGMVTVSIKKEDDKFIVIKVSDTGCGIPANQHSKIFTKLFRADNVIPMDTEGTGLGLYIVKSILDHSGATIGFVSEEHKGTTFTIELPLSGMKKRSGTRALLK
jgi:PAS domain S-box-containing protein